MTDLAKIDEDTAHDTEHKLRGDALLITSSREIALERLDISADLKRAIYRALADKRAHFCQSTAEQKRPGPNIVHFLIRNGINVPNEIAGTIQETTYRTAMECLYHALGLDVQAPDCDLSLPHGLAQQLVSLTPQSPQIPMELVEHVTSKQEQSLRFGPSSIKLNDRGIIEVTMYTNHRDKTLKFNAKSGARLGQ